MLPPDDARRRSLNLSSAIPATSMRHHRHSPPHQPLSLTDGSHSPPASARSETRQAVKLSRCDEPSSPACPMPMASTILQPTSRARAARAHARTLSFIPLSPPPSLVRSFSSEGVFVRRAPRTQQHGVQASAPARSTPQQHARGVPGRLAPDVHHVRVAVVCGSSRRPRRRHPIDCEHSARTTDHERTPSRTVDGGRPLWRGHLGEADGGAGACCS